MKQSIDSHRSRLQLLSAGVVLAVIALWFVLTESVIPELVFPSPAAVWNAVESLRGALVTHALVTLLRVSVGLGIGVFCGILFGLLLTSSKSLFAVANPLLEAVRPLPPVALIPFFIVWFGIGPLGQITLIALSSFMVLVIATFNAVNNVPPIYLRAASALGASRRSIYASVIVPAIMPHLVSGVRVAAALSFAVGVAAEFMGAQSGLGFLIMVARRTLNTDVILLGTIVLGLESFLVDRGIRTLFQYLCRWADVVPDALAGIAVAPNRRAES